MSYKENPKTKGSGIWCAIPQRGTCPNQCEDCFFQSGRSYLEPLDENLPNMPPLSECQQKIIRVNDGNDSNNYRKLVVEAVKPYPMKFYNTSMPHLLSSFDAPVVLTLNPGERTDTDFHRVGNCPQLMFVRFRVNTWNLPLCKMAVQYYGDRSTPIVLTFMAYFKGRIPDGHQDNYIYRKRTLNSYWAITTKAWREVMKSFEDTPWEKWVYSCGKIEGERGTSACARCGNCVREYFVTMERIK